MLGFGWHHLCFWEGASQRPAGFCQLWLWLWLGLRWAGLRWVELRGAGWPGLAWPGPALGEQMGRTGLGRSQTQGSQVQTGSSFVIISPSCTNSQRRHKAEHSKLAVQSPSVALKSKLSSVWSSQGQRNNLTSESITLHLATQCFHVSKT